MAGGNWKDIPLEELMNMKHTQEKWEKREDYPLEPSVKEVVDHLGISVVSPSSAYIFAHLLFR